MARVRLDRRRLRMQRQEEAEKRKRVEEAADRAEETAQTLHPNGHANGHGDLNGLSYKHTEYTRKPGASPPGRPRKLAYDAKTIETIVGLGSIRATLEEIRAVLRVSDMTFKEFLRDYPHVRDMYVDAYEEGKVSLRRKQINLAETSASMAIWLGKQWLDQRDRYEPPPQAAIPTVTVDAAQLAKLTPEQRLVLQDTLKILFPERFADLQLPKDIQGPSIDLQKGVEYHPDE